MFPSQRRHRRFQRQAAGILDPLVFRQFHVFYPVSVKGDIDRPHDGIKLPYRIQGHCGNAFPVRQGIPRLPGCFLRGRVIAPSLEHGHADRLFFRQHGVLPDRNGLPGRGVLPAVGVIDNIPAVLQHRPLGVKRVFPGRQGDYPARRVSRSAAIRLRVPAGKGPA